MEVAQGLGLRAVAVTAPEEEVQGVNDRAQLAAVERDLQNRLHGGNGVGVTLIAPETVFFSYDTQIGRDTVVEPNVVFGPGVVIDENVIIHAFSHLEGAHVASGGTVGPFARLRPGASLGPKAKVGNFVEIKNVDLGAGAKVSHLTYLGDASVGAEVNIGAGTITCNYDGYRKYRTVIGQGAFIGSNSSLWPRSPSATERSWAPAPSSRMTCRRTVSLSPRPPGREGGMVARLPRAFGGRQAREMKRPISNPFT